jgi:hypothetical protein
MTACILFQRSEPTLLEWYVVKVRSHCEQVASTVLQAKV